MTLPRNILLGAWILVTAFAYYAILFTQLGNYYHGGGPVDHALVGVEVAVGTFLSLEVFRAERRILLKIGAALIGVPLALLTCASLWFGIKNVL
jgi:hypothetical protein